MEKAIWKNIHDRKIKLKEKLGQVLKDQDTRFKSLNFIEKVDP